MGFLAPILGAVLSSVAGSLVQGMFSQGNMPSAPTAGAPAPAQAAGSAVGQAQAAPPATSTGTGLADTGSRPPVMTDGTASAQAQQSTQPATQPQGTGFSSPTAAGDLLTDKSLI